MEMFALFFTQYATLTTLFAAMLLDIVTGLVAAWAEKRISSKLSREGMARKTGILLAVGAGAVLGKVTGIGIVEPIALFFTVTEVISVTENLGRSGVPLPPALMRVLATLKDRVEIVDTPAAPSEEKKAA